MDHKTKEQRILWLLQASWPNWTPAPELARISLQYSARIFSLQRKNWQIANRVRIVNGVQHGEFRLGPAPTPTGSKSRRGGDSDFRAPKGNQASESLFGVLAPDRSYRE